MKIESGHEIADHVICCNCGVELAVNCGVENCPICSMYGCLKWANPDQPEIKLLKESEHESI